MSTYPVSCKVDDVEVDIIICPTSTENAGHFRPSDRLQGHIRISSKEPLELSKVEIYLRGSQSIKTVASDATQRSRSHRILDVPLFPSLVEDVRVQQIDSEQTYNVHFFYIIPHGTDSLPSNGLPGSCRMLPPSTDRFFFHTNAWNAVPLPEVSIIYYLRAIVTYSRRDIPGAPQTTAVVSKFIALLPYNDVPPPVDIASYPGEFILNTRLPIRKSMLGKQLGFVTVSSEEPSPLTYISGLTGALTVCAIHLSVQGDAIDPWQLAQMTLKVRPLLHAKTYYSTESIPCMPNQRLLADRGLHMYDSVVALEAQSFANLQWTVSTSQMRLLVPEGQHAGENESDGSTYTRRGSSASQSSDVATSGRQDRADVIWQTTIRVPIQPARQLHPNFCSKLSARFYSMALQIQVGGVYARMMHLEVPLQVAYPPPFDARASRSDSTAPQRLLEESEMYISEAALPLSYNDPPPTYYAAIRSG